MDNPWRFTGEQQDPTGMYKIGHRYYQPETGRWTQPDPLQGRINPAMPGETNPYAYAGCNPINYTDPTGLCTAAVWDLVSGLPGPVSAGLSVVAAGGTVIKLGAALGVGTAAILGAGLPLIIAGGVATVAGVRSVC